MLFNESVEKYNRLAKKDIEKLPKTAGVYLFLEKREPIYIGKAINLKSRVKNHFLQPTYKDDMFTKKTTHIGFIETGSEIEALVLEAQLIKQHQPKFNSVWRDDKNYFYVAVADKKRPVVFITHQKNNPDIQYIGPFVEGNSLKKVLKFLRRVFPYYTSATHPKNKCPWCHLDVCPGPNPDLAEYKKNIKKLVLILQGKRKIVLSSLKKEMKALSDAKEFEKAMVVREKISALENIMSHTNVIEMQNAKIKMQNLVNEKWPLTEKMLQAILRMQTPISKIECYDISNIQGKQAVGSMVVFVNGQPDKNQYKKFRIRMKNEPNDIAMLKEMLQRRLAHREWPYPDIMLIDGGIAQLNVGVAGKNNFKDAKNIKIISIAKGKRELLIEDQQKHIPLKNLPPDIYNLIVHLDDEAHRFAITYHKELRRRNLLDI